MTNARMPHSSPLRSSLPRAKTGSSTEPRREGEEGSRGEVGGRRAWSSSIEKLRRGQAECGGVTEMRPVLTLTLSRKRE